MEDFSSGILIKGAYYSITIVVSLFNYIAPLHLNENSNNYYSLY